MFDNLVRYFNLLKCSGPTWGYYHNPTKSILILHLKNLEAEELFGVHHGFAVCTGAHSLGKYIRDDKSKGGWLKTQKNKWDRNICAVTNTTGKFTEESYTAVVHAIQLE